MVQRVPEGVVSVKVNENGLQLNRGKPEFFFRNICTAGAGSVDPGMRTIEERGNQFVLTRAQARDARRRGD